MVITLVLTTGLHWATLQTVAWGAMLAKNLRQQSLAQAVSETFDGEHPCCMCKAIAAAKKSEKKSESLANTFKMEFPPATEKIFLISPGSFSIFSPAEFFADSSCQKPPVPPPRGLFV